MSGAWSFKRHWGEGFPTDGCLAESFVSGLRAGVSRKREIPGWTETPFGMAEGFVYFIGIGSPYVTHVKIGFTAGDPAARLASLQTGCPFKMEMLGFVFGTKSQEAELHHVFSDSRCMGEWFEFEPFVETNVRHILEGRDVA